MRKRQGAEARRDRKSELLRIFKILNIHFGNLHWWPASSPFEVIVGAILTQNTNWQNVEKAIVNLKANSLMSPEAMFEAEDHLIAQHIRPSGYYNIKTARLKSFMKFLSENYESDLDKMFRQNTLSLREALLTVKGIGRETADSILLYAGNKAVFVIDAYTERILTRHGLIDGKAGYDEMQQLFMKQLPNRPDLFNQYHALIVNTGKMFCTKKAPRCEACPLGVLLKE
jgi:endonuclease III related protein